MAGPRGIGRMQQVLCAWPPVLAQPLPAGVSMKTGVSAVKGGAAYRNRTDDLFITSESLCRLS